jgi:hypothetical protein
VTLLTSPPDLNATSSATEQTKRMASLLPQRPQFHVGYEHGYLDSMCARATQVADTARPWLAERNRIIVPDQPAWIASHGDALRTPLRATRIVGLADMRAPDLSSAAP